MDVFNISCLSYINKTGQVSKAAVFSTLAASWTIVIGIIRGEYKVYIFFYIAAIYTGYSFINYDKKKASQKAKRAKVKVKFVKSVKDNHEVICSKSFSIGTEINDYKLLQKIGNFMNFCFKYRRC